MNPIDFIQRVMVLCYKYRGSVSSWGRTLLHNTSVGGVVDSFHMLWIGCDVVLDNMVKNPVLEKEADQMGLKAILEGDHYHFQPKF